MLSILHTWIICSRVNSTKVIRAQVLDSSWSHPSFIGFPRGLSFFLLKMLEGKGDIRLVLVTQLLEDKDAAHSFLYSQYLTYMLNEQKRRPEFGLLGGHILFLNLRSQVLVLVRSSMLCPEACCGSREGVLWLIFCVAMGRFQVC